MAAAAEDFLLVTEGLRKEFKGFVAVDGVSLKVRRGDIHALIGPNGAGKTTMFNLLTKFLRPSAGTVAFKGRDITQADPAETAHLGIVRSFQISAVFPHMTVLQNVRIALQRRLGTSFHFWRSKGTLDALNDRAMDLLDSVGLSKWRDQPAGHLSGGQQQRVAVARALAMNPALLLADEPTGNLDTQSADAVFALLRAVNREHGTAILFVTHNAALAARCDAIVRVVDGRIVEPAAATT